MAAGRRELTGRGDQWMFGESVEKEEPLFGKFMGIFDMMREGATKKDLFSCPILVRLRGLLLIESRAVNTIARFWEGEPPGEPRHHPARTEPRLAGIM
jgi:hypothetical protein